VIRRAERRRRSHVTASTATVFDVPASPPAEVALPGAPDDARLVARIAAGDESALKAVYDRYSPLVFGLARRVTGSSSTAEEVAQEVFVFLWEHPDRFDVTRGSLRSFLGSLTHRRSVDAVRRDSRRMAREERDHRDRAVGSTATPPADVAQRVADQDLADRVGAAVALLPADQRVAVELAYFGGCTFRDVALRLGIPEGTAKSRLRLALAKLGHLLTPEVAAS
jgi:RNA polymerase sigma-70 factor, ECF subfamily